MKIPLPKLPIFPLRSAATAAAFLVVLGISILAAISDHLSQRARAPLAALAKLATNEQQHTIEIYQPDGIHNLQEPPTDVLPIILKVPEKYRVYNSKGAIRDWGVNLLTYYPGFTSPEDGENAKFGLSCTGFCNGRMLITIENFGRNFKQINLSSKQYYSHAAVDIYARRLLQKKKDQLLPGYHQQNLHVTDYAPEAGFDVVFEELYTKMEDAPNIIPGHFADIHKFYLKWNQAREYYDLVADCHIPSGNNNFERFVCTLTFSLACNPAVSVKATGADGKFLPEFGNIQSATDRFVSSMIIEPACNS